MTDFSEMPPPPVIIDAADNTEVLLPAESVGVLAEHIARHGHMDERMVPLLEALIDLVGTSGKGSSGILKLIIERALPPPLSRAESWWVHHVQLLREQMGQTITEDMTLADIARWLTDNVRLGILPPATAAELIGHFRILHAAGGFSRQSAPTSRSLVAVK